MELAVFNYEQSQIRTAIGKNGEMLFAAMDICDILELSNVSQALTRIDDDEKDEIRSTDNIGRNQLITAINESGVYNLTFTSKKPGAKKFRKWITSEVIPSIRKTGSYTAKTKTNTTITEASSVYRSLRSVAKSMGLEGNQLTISVNRATKEITQIDFQNLLGMNLLTNGSQEHQFTATDLGKRLGLSAIKFNKMLEQSGLQIKTDGVWIPTQKGKEFAVLLDTAKKHSNGTPIVQVKWKESVLEIL